MFTIGGPPPPFPELPGASTPLELNMALPDQGFLGSLVNNPHTIFLPYKDVMAQAESEIESGLAHSSPS